MLADFISSPLTTVRIPSEPGLECHPHIDLPTDFRAIESEIGYLDLAINDYVVFAGGKPCYVGSKDFWGNSEHNPDLSKIVFLGFDVDGVHYGYRLEHDGWKLVQWDYTVDSAEQSEHQDFIGLLLYLLDIHFCKTGRYS